MPSPTTLQMVCHCLHFIPEHRASTQQMSRAWTYPRTHELCPALLPLTLVPRFVSICESSEVFFFDDLNVMGLIWWVQYNGFNPTDSIQWSEFKQFSLSTSIQWAQSNRTQNIGNDQIKIIDRLTYSCSMVLI